MRVIIVSLIFCSYNSFSQNNILFRFGINTNVNIYAPYTSKLNPIKSPYNIKSNTSEVNLEFQNFKRKRISIYTGLSYKFIAHKIKDAVDSIVYLETLGGNIPGYLESYVYEDKPDLKSFSHSLGLSLEIKYALKTKERYSMSLGLRPTIYFLEWFKAKYVSSDVDSSPNISYPDNPDYVGPTPPVTKLPRNFFLSSINSQLIYRITLLPKTGRTTLTGKVSLGANIFSDWSQFKRYAWLGVGLELGFLDKEKE